MARGVRKTYEEKLEVLNGEIMVLEEKLKGLRSKEKNFKEKSRTS